MLRVTLTPVTVPSATTAPSKSLPAGRKVDGGMIDGFRYSLGLLISFSFFFFFNCGFLSFHAWSPRSFVAEVS